MAGAGKKWLIGCGLGCLAVILFLVALVGGSALLFKNVVSSWKEAAGTESELVRVHGAAGDFQPAWDGTVAPDRLDVFLGVREDIAEIRDELATVLPSGAAALDSSSTGLEKAWRALRLGPRLGTLLADFLKARTAALLDRGMGLGEYTYIYTLTYFGWLGEDPGAGPEHVEISSGGRGGAFHYDSESSGDDQSRAKRQRIVRRQLNDLQRRWFGAMLAQSPPESAVEPDARRELVAAEADRLAGSSDAVAWEQGLPEYLAAGLRPYRDRLAAAWCEPCNTFELIFLEDEAPDEDRSDDRRDAI